MRWKKSGERIISCFLFLFLWLTRLILLIGVLGLPIISFKGSLEITCLWLPAEEEAELYCCLCCLETGSPCEKYLCNVYQAMNIQKYSKYICWSNVVKPVQPLRDASQTVPILIAERNIEMGEFYRDVNFVAQAVCFLFLMHFILEVVPFPCEILVSYLRSSLKSLSFP